MTAPLHDRRSFVTGEAGQDEFARAMLGDEPETEPEWFDAGPTVRLGKVAMACDVEVVLNPEDNGFLSVASAALDRIDEAESLYSVYRPETELSCLNREAPNGPVEVSPELYALLKRAREFADRTDGAFSPTSGPLVALWRRFRSEGRLPLDEELATALELSDLRNVQFDDMKSTIAFMRPGVSLHLNAMGKGAALEPAVELLETAGCSSCLLHAGYSSVVARGDRSGGLPGSHRDCGSGWLCGIRNPLLAHRRLATLRLCDQALSTSGNGAQWYRVGDRRIGHLFDPRTGQPVEHALSVSVVAPDGAMAEALSTAFFVLGVEKASRHCHNSGSVGCVFVPPPTHGRLLEPVVIGLTPEQIRFEESEVARVHWM
jgi:thiamine biosynthesis lipoprotein